MAGKIEAKTPTELVVTTDAIRWQDPLIAAAVNNVFGDGSMVLGNTYAATDGRRCTVREVTYRNGLVHNIATSLYPEFTGNGRQLYDALVRDRRENISYEAALDSYHSALLADPVVVEQLASEVRSRLSAREGNL